MSKCVVTQLETDNKWKNMHVHPTVLKLARLRANAQLSTRQVLKDMQERFIRKLNSERPDSPQKATELLQAFLKEYL